MRGNMSTKMCLYTFQVFSAGCFVIALFMLWPLIQYSWSHMINVDIAYLTLSAQRLLAGQAMSEAYYDTNLPLSILVQVPAVLIGTFGKIPLYYATTLYIYILLVASVLVTAFLLQKIESLSRFQRLTVLIVYLVINIAKPGYDFGQKDHILGMALFPLVLTQILITARVDLNGFLKWSVLLAGSILILLKPHYGIVPAAIFIHRAISQNRLTVFRDVDFLCLSLAVLAYVAVIFIFFGDFVAVILPDIMRYYMAPVPSQLIYVGMMLSLQISIPLFICLFFLKKAPKLIPALSVVALLCLVPFVIQGKGWGYHVLPADLFAYTCFALFIHSVIALGVERIRSGPWGDILGFVLTFVLLMGLLSQKADKIPNIPTHQDYINTELAQIIGQGCATLPCSFFLFNDMINMAPELSVYTGQAHASRFPVMWFLPHMLYAQDALKKGHPSAPMTQKELDTARKKYMTMVLKDFQRYTPETLIIGHVVFNQDYGVGAAPFDFVTYTVNSDPRFQAFWDGYILEQSLDIDRIHYMIGKLPGEDLVRYDIYKRQK